MYSSLWEQAVGWGYNILLQNVKLVIVKICDQNHSRVMQILAELAINCTVMVTGREWCLAQRDCCTLEGNSYVRDEVELKDHYVEKGPEFSKFDFTDCNEIKCGCFKGTHILAFHMIYVFPCEYHRMNSQRNKLIMFFYQLFYRKCLTWIQNLCKLAQEPNSRVNKEARNHSTSL